MVISRIEVSMFFIKVNYYSASLTPANKAFSCWPLCFPVVWKPVFPSGRSSVCMSVFLVSHLCVYLAYSPDPACSPRFMKCEQLSRWCISYSGGLCVAFGATDDGLWYMWAFSHRDCENKSCTVEVWKPTSKMRGKNKEGLFLSGWQRKSAAIHKTDHASFNMVSAERDSRLWPASFVPT